MIINNVYQNVQKLVGLTPHGKDVKIQVIQVRILNPLSQILVLLRSYQHYITELYHAILQAS